MEYNVRKLNPSNRHYVIACMDRHNDYTFLHEPAGVFTTSTSHATVYNSESEAFEKLEEARRDLRIDTQFGGGLTVIPFELKLNIEAIGNLQSETAQTVRTVL